MIPTLFRDTLIREDSSIAKETRTYKLDYVHNRIAGMTDGLDAVVQACYKILNTERYAFPIYSDQYGVELLDLIGKDKAYVKAVLPTRITDALIYEERIIDVKDFVFTELSDGFDVTFKVVSIYGEVILERSVSV